MPSPSNIKAGSAYVDLTVNNSRLIRGLRSAQRRLRAFSAGVRRLGMSILKVSAIVGGPLALAAVAFGRMGDQVEKMSRRTGLSTRALSELGFAAEQSGADVNSLSNAVLRMNRRIGRIRAGEGTTTQVEAMGALGLSATELSRMSPEETLYAIADAMATMEDKTAAAGLAQRAFGTEVDTILPLLFEGSEGMAKLRAEARDLGVSIGEKDAKAAAEFTDALNRLKRAALGGLFRVGAAIAPLITKLADKVAHVVARVSEWIQQNRAFVASAAKIIAIVAAVGAGLVAVSAAGSALAFIFGGIASIITGAVTALGFLASAIGLLFTPVAAVIAAVVALGGVLLWASGAGGKAVDWLLDKWQGLKDGVMRTLGAIGKAIAAGDLKLAMKVLWASLKLAWLKGTHWLRETWTGLKFYLVKVWTKAFFAIQKHLINFWDGAHAAWAIGTGALQETWETALHGMRSMVDWFGKSVIKGFAGMMGGVNKLIGSAVDVILRPIAGDEVADRVREQMDANQQWWQDASSKAEQDYRRRREARAEAHADRMADIEDDTNDELARIGNENKTAMDQLEKDRTSALEDVDKRRNEELDAQQRALDDARADWEEALRDAEDAGAGDGSPGDSDSETPPGTPQFSAAGIRAALKGVESRGTFSGVAAFGMGAGGSAVDRTADATEKTARNTQRLVDEAAKGGLTFG